MDSLQFILIAHLFSTFAMTGVIWLVHLLTYPAMRLIEHKSYASYHQFHTSRIGLVVIPLMLLEMMTSVALLILETSKIFFIFNFLGLLLIWFNTFFHSVPAHQKLINQKNEQALEHLIKMNLIRTLVWTARSIALMGGLVYGTISF